MERYYYLMISPFLHFDFYSLAYLTENEIYNLGEHSLSLGCLNTVITAGNKGAYLINKQKLYFQPAFEAEVIDTLGAGDSFISYLLVHYLKDAKFSQALYALASFAAQTCRSYGAIGYPAQY